MLSIRFSKGVISGVSAQRDAVLENSAKSSRSMEMKFLIMLGLCNLYLGEGLLMYDLKKVIDFELVVFLGVFPIVLWKIYWKVQKN